MISKERSAAVGCAEAGALGAAKDAVIPANYSINNTKSGHGIMAEEAQTIIDRLHGKTAEVVGRDNAKNGADRLVDGVYIQTKFYNSGKGCAAACFDGENGGMYKYIGPDGQPMPVEVPKDFRDAAIGEMRRRIADGKVPGARERSDIRAVGQALHAAYARVAPLRLRRGVCALCGPVCRQCCGGLDNRAPRRQRQKAGVKKRHQVGRLRVRFVLHNTHNLLTVREDRAV